MGCSGNSNRLDQQGDRKIMVHGDVFNSDTRTVLQILEIGEVDFGFREASSNTIEAALKPVAKSDDKLGQDFMNIA